MKTVLVTFADSRLRPSRDRLVSQAESMQIYDRIIALDEHDLSPEFRSRFADKLVPGTKGYGWMCWKPEVVLRVLDTLDEGDQLHWCDADMHLNPSGRERMLDYIQQAQQSPSGCLAFDYRLPEASELKFYAIGIPQIERKFTKGDLFDYFKCRNRSDITDSQQLASGFVFFTKNPISLEIVQRWAEVPHHDFTLQDDTPSRSDNFPEFIAHRHDQSVLSILFKIYRVRNLSFHELGFPVSFNCKKHKVVVEFDRLAKYPIHARNDKEYLL